jgi:cytochrome P450
LAAVTSASPDEKIQNTMVYAIVQSDLPPAEKSFDRVFEEVATVTGAGYETTANVLRLILYHVYSNKEILQHLREELASISNVTSSFNELKTLEQQPYLTAILMEGMRLSPAVASRAARVTDKDLLYDKWRIPAGTPVGMTTLLMHTDEALYPDPLRFNPGRWMEPAARATSVSKFAPFSKGSRICLGMQ